jgi:hypothetical protein
MTEITITNNRASRAIVALHPVPAVQDLHHLQISSQWLGVKAPQGLHSMISLCPDTADLRALHAWLGTYLQVNADSPAAQPAPVQALEHEPENEPHVSLASVQEDWGPGPHEVHSLPAQPAVPQALQAARLPADDTEGGAA